MTRFFEIHPRNPQPRLVSQVVDLLRADSLIAYPTDSCYALGCTLECPDGVERIRKIRHLGPDHHYTLVCSDISQVSQFVHLSNPTFRAVKAATPGAYTFILPATREIPRRIAHPKKRTIGVRIPDSRVVHDLLAELGGPLVSSTLLLPDEPEPMTEAWRIDEALGSSIDAVIDAGECGREPTTVVDLTGPEAIIRRVGAGDPERFE